VQVPFLCGGSRLPEPPEPTKLPAHFGSRSFRVPERVAGLRFPAVAPALQQLASLLLVDPALQEEKAVAGTPVRHARIARVLEVDDGAHGVVRPRIEVAEVRVADRIPPVPFAHREREGVVRATVLVVALARLAEEVGGARRIAPYANAVVDPYAELETVARVAGVARLLQVQGADDGEQQQGEGGRRHVLDQSSALISRDPTDSSLTSAGTEPSSGKKRSSARRTSSSVCRSGAIRRNASPPRRPRVYHSRCLRSSRFASSSASRVSSEWCSCPPFGRYGRARADPAAGTMRCLPCLSSIAMRTWRRMVARHSCTVTGAGVSPRSSASSSRKIHG